MELDIDSDNGGCIDSYEDGNLDGIFSSQYQETSNFDPTDDLCYSLDMYWTFRDDWGNTTAIWFGSFGIDETNDISGVGVVTLSHAGTCTDSEMIASFTIQGTLEEQIEIEIIHQETFEISTFSSEELKPDCTMGMAIEENWAVSYGIYAGMPEQLIIPTTVTSLAYTAELVTDSNSPRRASIDLTARYINN
jgi:hypothetical protein